MDTQNINERYTSLLASFGISAEIVEVNAPSLPRQEILAKDGHFLIRLNPPKFLPGLTYESYVAYCARSILLPRLVLETERLTLRRYKSKDAADCFAFLSDEKGAYMDCCKAFRAMDGEYAQQLELFSQRETQYMIELKDTGKVIGTIHVFPEDSRAVDAMEIGYSVSPAYQRQGYAYEALSSLLKLLQKDLLLELVVAGVLPENIPSIQLLRKLGFQPEGLRHKAVWHEGINAPVDLQYFYLDIT